MFRATVFAFAFITPALFAADEFTPVPGRHVQVGGEIGRRIGVTVSNNLLAIDVEKDFLAPLAARDPKSGYIGLGKLLMATVRLAAYTADPKVVEWKDRLAARILAAQEPDGYLGYFSPAHRMTRLWDIHEMGYLAAGLADNYLLSGHKPSLDGAVRLADYILTHWNKLPPDWGKSTGVAPHVAVTGLERTLVTLARAAGGTRFLEFVVGPRALVSWNAPIVIGRRSGIEGHIYAYMARALAQLELYRMRPDPKLLAAADRAVGFLRDEGMAVSGGAGQWEIWTDDQDVRGQLGETCATAYQIRVYESLLRLRGEACYGDLMERTIHNALFAAQSPDGRRIRYYAPLEGPREYHPVDTYCCPNNYRRIVSELPEMIYYRRGRGVAVNLYTASEAAVDVDGVRVSLTQETVFPGNGEVAIRVEPAQPVAFALSLRIPLWAAGAALRVNGEPAAAVPGTFAVVDRRWQPGDRVELTLPMKPRLVRGRQRQAGRAAVLRGPLVYALNPARDPGLAKLDGADLGRLTLDPDSLEVIAHDGVRPGGSGVRVGAWKPGHGLAAKHDLELTLTEFPDPGAMAAYFRLRDPSVAAGDELHRRAGRE